MTAYFFFAIAALLLLGLIYLVWRLWGEYTQVSPEDEELERSIASLNDAQANRSSDQQIVRPMDADTGWDIMVRRGQQAARRPRPPRRPPR
jgi:hypothetical protein